MSFHERAATCTSGDLCSSIGYYLRKFVFGSSFITGEPVLRGPSGWNLVKLKNFSPKFFFGKIFTWLYLDFEYVACFYINYFAESKSGLLWTLFFRCHGNQFKTRAFFPNYFWGVNAVPRSWVWKQTVVHSRFLEVTFEAWLLSYKEL